MLKHKTKGETVAKVRMRLGDSPSQKQQKESFLKEQLKDESFDYVMGKMLDNIKITKANGIANIAIPEPTLQIVLGFLSEFQNTLKKTNTKEIGR